MLSPELNELRLRGAESVPTATLGPTPATMVAEMSVREREVNVQREGHLNPIQSARQKEVELAGARLK